MRTEIFYGIRIGDSRRNTPYLQLTNGGDRIVQLFDSEEKAERELKWRPGKKTKVVRVKVSYAGR